VNKAENTGIIEIVTKGKEAMQINRIMSYPAHDNAQPVKTKEEEGAKKDRFRNPW
jgi:hypothetical protein